MLGKHFRILCAILVCCLFAAAGCAKPTAVKPAPDTETEQTAEAAIAATDDPSAGPQTPKPFSCSSGLIVVGDSRCCQLGSYQRNTGRNDFAVFATWGGHYIPGIRPQILTDSVLAEIETCFRAQIESCGSCVIWFFATVNDYNYTDSSNSAGISAAILAAERLVGMKYEYNGETCHPRVIVVGFDGCRAEGMMNGIPQEDFNRYIADYNEKLRAAVKRSGLLAPDARYFTTVPEIVGGKAGFVEDGLHYDDATLEAIIAYITGGADR